MLTIFFQFIFTVKSPLQLFGVLCNSRGLVTSTEASKHNRASAAVAPLAAGENVTDECPRGAGHCTGPGGGGRAASEGEGGREGGEGAAPPVKRTKERTDEPGCERSGMECGENGK